MRLALLGLDDTTLALALAAKQTARDELVLICDVAKLHADLGELADRQHPWEALLTGQAGVAAPFDAVLVAREAADDERRLEQLRKLVQAGVPLLVSHPVHASMLAYYELDMIRRETNCVMLPYLPRRLHPLAIRLQTWIDQPAESPIGMVDQVIFERSLADRSKAAVCSQFARDVDLLRFFGGEVAQLGATGAPGETATGQFAAYNNLAVHLAARAGRSLRWQVGPADELPGGRVTVTGQRGRAVLTIPHEPAGAGGQNAWRLETRAGGEPQIAEVSEWDGRVAALDELRAALAGQNAASRWLDAARSVELAETIERSLTKGRTIDLHEQEYSDTATFKGLMTSIGCALLLVALGALVVGTLAANLLKHAGAERAAQVVGAVPYVLLALFGAFLAVQFLLKLTQRGNSIASTEAGKRVEDVSQKPEV